MEKTEYQEYYHCLHFELSQNQRLPLTQEEFEYNVFTQYSSLIRTFYITEPSTESTCQ